MKHTLSQTKEHEALPDWPFSMLVFERSDTSKTNIFANLVLKDKSEHIYKRQKREFRYIRYNDLIVYGYHSDKPKWAFVKYIYGIIAKDPKALYYKNIQFSYISPERISNVKLFSPERSTVIIFKDLCVILKYIQNQIIPFFTHERHRNILPIYITQRYYKIPIIIYENISYLVIFNGGSSYQDVFRIVSRYTDDIKNASMVINSYL